MTVGNKLTPLQILTEINANLPDNFAEQITPAVVRQILADISASYATSISSVGVSILDFGGVADGSKDNTAALTAAMASFSNSAFSAYLTGPRIRFPAAAKSYFFAGVINLKQTVILEGDTSPQAGGGALASVLQFPANSGGFIVNYYNTFGTGVQSPATTGADGTTFRNLAILGGGGTQDTTGEKAGIWCRAQTRIEDCSINNFPGDSVRIVAGIGSGGALEGQASGCEFSNVVVNNSGRHGLYIQGGDANTCHTVRFNVHSAGCCGLLDQCFLSSQHDMFQVDSCNTKQMCQVSYTDGNAYQLIDNTAGIGASTTPGTNNAVWYLLGTTGAFPGLPAWSNSGTYIPGSPILTQGVDQAVLLNAPYTESGFPLNHSSVGTLVINPVLQPGGWTIYSKLMGENDANGAPFTMYNTGVFNTITYTQSSTIYEIIAGIGEFGSTNFLGTWISFYDKQNWPFILRWQANLGGSPSGSTADLILAYSDGIPEIAYITGPNTTQQFGTGAAVPLIHGFPTIGIGSGLNARRQTYSTAAPTSGTWARGDFVWNTAPSSGGTLGWSCTVAGTPGTWTALTLN